MRRDAMFMALYGRAESRGSGRWRRRRPFESGWLVLRACLPQRSAVSRRAQLGEPAPAAAAAASPERPAALPAVTQSVIWLKAAAAAAEADGVAAAN